VVQSATTSCEWCISAWTCPRPVHSLLTMDVALNPIQGNGVRGVNPEGKRGKIVPLKFVNKTYRIWEGSREGVRSVVVF